jgi:FtsP/CotA-like multicopper oxidase with cupredoxin domain
MAAVRANRPLELTAVIRHELLLPGRATDLWAYRGSVNGASLINPLLRLNRGETLDVTLTNRLGEDTTIHWHGLHVDERNDGSGLHPVASGASYR